MMLNSVLPSVSRRVSQWLTLLLVLLLTLPLAACATTGIVDQGDLPADFGSYGADAALALAAKYPYRSPGSSQETAAAQWIAAAFKDLGYKPEVVPFSFTDTAGAKRQSSNVIVKIEGSGFRVTDAQNQTRTVSRQVIVGAHYDVSVTKEEADAAKTTTSTKKTNSLTGVAEPTLADFDGIHDNASGVGTLLTIASELKSQQPGYDVILIAFGAGEAGQAGAKAYAAGLDKTTVTETDAMYNIEAIYAGDKVYAHAGQNSVLANNQKIYEKRRKLYEVTDVFYEYELNTNNKFNLNTNQSSLEVPWPDDANQVLYREWTLTESDHTPFDKLDIPIVYFESFDYNASKLKNMKESQNPAFTSTKGAIRHTRYDSTDFLQALLNQNKTLATTTTGTGQTTSTAKANQTSQTSKTSKTSKTTAATTAKTSATSAETTAAAEAVTDQLTRRVNNVAFLVVQAIHKGMKVG